MGATTTTANGYTNPSSGCGIATSPKDVWFRFTTLAGQTAATVSVTGSAAGQIRVFSAASSAGPFTQVGCAAGTGNNTQSAPAVLTGLTGNTTYYVSVAGYGSGDTQGAFTICVTGTGVAAPANDECATASLLTSGTACAPTFGTTVGATASAGAAPCSSALGVANDVWYRFVATSTAHNVTVVSSATLDAVVDVRSGPCPGVNIACADVLGTGGTEVASLTGLTVGATYYVRVYAFGDATTDFGTFTICVTNSAAAVCNNPADVQIVNVGTTTAQVTFTPVAGNTSFTITYTPTGGATTTVTATTSPVTLTGLTPATNYTLTFQSVCAAGGTATVLSGSFTTLATTALANDNPTGAAVLTVASTCVPVSSTNLGATTTTANGYVNPSTGCGIATAPKDVWFRFTTLTGQTAATVMVTGSAAGQIRVFSATSSAGPFTQVGCAAGTTNNTVSAPLSLAGLTGNTTYYVSVAGYGSGDVQGAFTICVTGTGTVGAPTNDDPTGATLLTVSSICAPTSSTNAGATTTVANGYTIPSTGCGVATSPKDVWFKFTTLTGQTTATITVTGSAAGQIRLFGASTNAGPFIQLGCNAGTTNNTVSAPLTVTTLGGSTTYYVSVAGYGSGDTQGAFTICVTGTGVPAPSNDECANATLLTSNATCVPTNGTTVGATQSLAPILCGGFTGTSDDDVWYRFVATSTAHSVTVVGNAFFDAIIDVRSGACPGVNIGCADASTLGGTEVASLSGLTVGATYYVRVYSYLANSIATSQNTFTICVTTGTTVLCVTPTDFNVVNVTNTSAQVTFTPVAGNNNYTIIYGPTAGGPTTTVTPAPSTSPVLISGLTPGVTYSLSFQANCSTGGTATTLTIAFTTQTVAPPTNDNPTGATLLTVNTACAATSSTNAGASFTPPNGYVVPSTTPASCGAAVAPKDVWFRFTTLNGQTSAIVAVTGNPAGQIRAFSAPSNAGPFTQLGCSAGATNNTVAPALSLTGLTGNTTYYVAVAGYGSGDTQGAFTICVIGTGTPPCPNVTGVSSANVTATTATLSFSTAAGATNYTVVATPTGGTPVAQAFTGSPVNLTGLLPGRVYSVCVTAHCGAGNSSATPTCTTFTTAFPPCPVVTNLAVGSIGTTGASVSFTPAAGATGYTIAYTPQGGTTTTQTATGSPVNLSGLTPGTAYTVVVTTNCPSAQISAGVTTTFNTVCPDVTGVTTTSLTPTSAVLSFAAAAGATGYTVTVTPTGGSASTQTATGSPVNLTGLAPGTVYSVCVRANCSGSNTSGQTCSTFTTPFPPCPAATNLAVGNVTTTGASLSFTPAAGATGYTVTYTPTGGATTTQAATGSPVTLAGLTPSTLHTVTVTTNCAFSQTSPAASTTFTTATPCLAVTGLAAGSISTTGATLTFTPPTAGATSFTVTYTPAGGATITQTATGSPVVLTGLLPSTQYAVTVATNCGSGVTSPLASTSFGTTNPVCNAATNAAAGNITTTSASVSFTPAAGAVNYTVSVTPAGGSTTTLTTTSSPLALTGLTPGTAYTVNIVTNCAFGQTSGSVTVTFTTPFPPCPAITGLAASGATTTGATLTFTPATGATGATGYVVTVTPQGGMPTSQTATGSPVALTGLTPNTPYTVSVVTSCAGSQTSAAVTTTFTTPFPPCPAITGLAATGVTTTDATLTFTPATGATSYVVTVTPQGGAPSSQTVTGSPVNLTGLTPNTPYTVSIVTSCAGSQTSPAVTTTFTTAIPPCQAITNLTATSVTDVTASLTFTPATGAASYGVTITPQGGTPSALTATGSPVNLTGLLPGTAYTVSVVTVCNAGQNSPAVTTTFTTTAPAPTNGVAASITDRGASISFSPAAGATSYTVTITPQGGTPTTLTLTGSPATLTGLTAGTNYTVTIVANYPGGGASAPLTVSFSTLMGSATRTTLAGGLLAVYPNPAHHAFTLSLPALGTTRTARLTLVNALGQTVQSQTLTLGASGTQALVDITGVATGLYTVRVQAGTEVAAARLSIE